MESINCLICQSNDHQVLSYKGRYGTAIRTVVCKNCGFVFTNPRLDKKETELYYEHFYHIFARGTEAPTEKYLKHQRTRGKKIQTFLEESGVSIEPIKSVLDVGSSAGGVLDFFRSLGVKKTKGIEPSQKFSEFSRKELGLDVDTTTIEEADLSDKFDLILLSDVFEHVLYPDHLLDILLPLTHPDTVLYIETTNVFISMHTLEPYNYEFHYSHNFLFSTNSLENILRQHGFTPFAFRPERYLKCLARPTKDSSEKLKIKKDSISEIDSTIKKHDRFLWLRRLRSKVGKLLPHK